MRCGEPASSSSPWPRERSGRGERDEAREDPVAARCGTAPTSQTTRSIHCRLIARGDRVKVVREALACAMSVDHPDETARDRWRARAGNPPSSDEPEDDGARRVPRSRASARSQGPRGSRPNVRGQMKRYIAGTSDERDAEERGRCRAYAAGTRAARARPRRRRARRTTEPRRIDAAHLADRRRA